MRQQDFVCILDKEEFFVGVEKSQLTITKIVSGGKFLILTASNLTDSFFHQNDIRLYVNESDKFKKSSRVSLELFR